MFLELVCLVDYLTFLKILIQRNGTESCYFSDTSDMGVGLLTSLIELPLSDIEASDLVRIRTLSTKKPSGGTN